jgi:hypothetical protein
MDEEKAAGARPMDNNGKNNAQNNRKQRGTFCAQRGRPDSTGEIGHCDHSVF